VKTLFNKLKSADETVDIPKMLSNLTGTECDTVDFKNQFFKDLYKEIYNKGKGDQLLRKLEQYDSNNDGKINADHLIQVLTEVTTRFSDV
jgi:Ca2+-binding EF-hand superfamily protein